MFDIGDAQALSVQAQPTANHQVMVRQTVRFEVGNNMEIPCAVRLLTEVYDGQFAGEES